MKSSKASLSIVRNKTNANVAIIEAGDLGEKYWRVKIQIMRKYILAALLNWNRRLYGAQVKNVYLVVRTLFVNLSCEEGG